jgi:hypothetical protein
MAIAVSAEKNTPPNANKFFISSGAINTTYYKDNFNYELNE